jgi:Bifunctional DNA primase/polymerase, N-terminal
MTGANNSTKLGECACEYAERGLSVLPAIGKAPHLIPEGFKSASNDPDKVRGWWKRWPEANIGIACDASDLVVLDVDARSSGFDTLDELESMCELPRTPCSQTGGGGLHAFFCFPGVALKGKLPGIDIKHHGYVIAPPSVHASGKRYEWIIDLDQPLNSLPGPWLERLSRKPQEACSNGLPITTPTCVQQSDKNDDWLHAAEDLLGWHEREANWRRSLMDYHIHYLHTQPERGWTLGSQTRSEVECSIVSRWVWDGASDRQIIELADAYLARHIEERAKRGYDYLDRTIANARRHLYEEGSRISSPLGGWPRKREAKHRWTSNDELAAALELVQGQLQSEWIRELQDCGYPSKTAYRIRDRLREQGLIRIEGKRVLRGTQD